MVAGRVIAGVDGSPHSVAALDWAATEARLRGGELVVVTVCGRDRPRPAPGDLPASRPAEAGQACRDMQARLLAGLSPDPVAHRGMCITHGDPVEALTRTATGDDVLVTGTRGNSPLRSLLLGSVAQGCAERAPCPVVVVPAATRQGAADGPVAVGVDPSAQAQSALRFAAQEAALRDVPLIAVHAVYPDYIREPSALDQPQDWDLLGPLDSAWAQLDAFIRAEPATAGTQVQPSVVPGDPGKVLLDWTHSAALVVVGSSGTGRLHAALLGSVSTHLLRRGHCPIAVMPAPPG